MDAPCQACTHGPGGFAGHDELTVFTIGDGCLMLRCRACDSCWSRTLVKEGYFAWAALTERMAAGAGMGIEVPRPGAACVMRELPLRSGGTCGQRPARGT
jgi:hypothetical protein